MSDLHIDLANYIEENSNFITFEQAQEMIFNMEQDELDELITEMEAK